MNKLPYKSLVSLPTRLNFKLTFLLLIFFINVSLLAKITGKVTDESSIGVASVLIALEKDTGDGNPVQIDTTLSDLQGNFSFEIPVADVYFLKFVKRGFDDRTITLTVSGDQAITVALKKINVLNEVRVERVRNKNLSERDAVSSTVLDEEEVRNIKIDKVDDLSSVSASLLSVNTGSSLTSFFSLRGVSSANTTDPLVGLYIDDIAQFQSYNFPIHLNNITSIEILKGPQLTFYGRNAMGGIIDIKTQKPLSRLSVNLNGDWGNYGLQKYNASLTVPLVNEVALLNFGGFYNFVDGYYRNTTLEKNTGGEESFGAFLGTSLFFRNLEFDIGTKYERNDEEAFPYSQNLAETEASPFTITHNQDTRNIKQTIDNFVKIKFPIEYFVFNSVTTYQYFNNDLIFDLDFSNIADSTLDLDFNSHLVTQEFKLNSTSLSSEYFSWLSGSYLYYQNRNISSGFLFNDNTTKVGTRENAAGVALYGSVTYPIIPAIHLILGLRGDYDYRGSIISRTTFGGEEPDVTDEVHDFNYAPKLSLNFYPVDDLLIYISGTRGYRNGGINAFVSDSEKVLYSSESSWNAELGLKYGFFGGSLSSSLYYIYWQNQQVNVVFTSDSSLFEFGIVNAGQSQNLGYELELATPNFWGFTVGGNFSYIYSRYLDFQLEDFTNERQDVSGNTQSFVPNLSGAAYLEYKLPFEQSLAETDNFTIRTTFKYIGEVFFDSFNAQSQKPYYLLDVTANLQLAGFILSFWMKNVLNQEYYSLIFDTGIADLTPNKLGDPRVFGVKISLIY